MRSSAGVVTFVLVGVLGVAGAAGETPPPQTIESIHMAGAISLEPGGDYSVLSLHTCALKGEFISCDYVLTSHRSSAFNYRYGGRSWESKLVDNFKVDHPQVRGYFLNGRGEHKEEVTLTEGEWSWVIQEYSHPATDITAVKVVFPGGKYISATIE